MEGFNSIGFSGEKSTYFGLIAGVNSIGFSDEKSTYFGLKKGLNSAAFSVPVSVGKIFLAAAPYTGLAFVSINDGNTSYEIEVNDGVFLIYHTYNLAGGTNFTVTVNSFTYQSVINIVAGAFNVYEFHLTDVAVLWDFVRVTSELPYSVTGFQISNAFLRDFSQNPQVLPDYPITFAPSSYISNETNFLYGYAFADTWLEADASYTIDLTAEGFGTRLISEHIIMPFKT